MVVIVMVISIVTVAQETGIRRRSHHTGRMAARRRPMAALRAFARPGVQICARGPGFCVVDERTGQVVPLGLCYILTKIEAAL